MEKFSSGTRSTPVVEKGRRAMVQAIALALGLAIQEGCAFQETLKEGSPIAHQNIDWMVSGRTTEQEVLFRLGPPTAKEGRVYAYDYFRDTSFVLLLVAGWSNLEGDRLVIFFDDRRVVRNWFRTGAPPEPKV
jgi:outer membrane protein assembly factor BamE (lipoprotein component of BamABCDE complex)